jgi:hypothetical protein
MRRSNPWARRSIREGEAPAEPGPASTAHRGSAGAAPSPDEGRNINWRSWLSLAWMVGFGVLYALMILKEKAPELYARISGGG